MTKEQFELSILQNDPPVGIPVYALSLWYDKKGDWNMAHTLIQDIADEKAAWIHAYLHRKEGDIWNADYWYNKAKKKRPAVSLNEEWTTLVEVFIS